MLGGNTQLGGPESRPNYQGMFMFGEGFHSLQIDPHSYCSGVQRLGEAEVGVCTLEGSSAPERARRAKPHVNWACAPASPIPIRGQRRKTGALAAGAGCCCSGLRPWGWAFRRSVLAGAGPSHRVSPGRDHVSPCAWLLTGALGMTRYKRSPGQAGGYRHR